MRRWFSSESAALPGLCRALRRAKNHIVYRTSIPQIIVLFKCPYGDFSAICGDFFAVLRKTARIVRRKRPGQSILARISVL